MYIPKIKNFPANDSVRKTDKTFEPKIIRGFSQKNAHGTILKLLIIIIYKVLAYFV